MATDKPIKDPIYYRPLIIPGYFATIFFFPDTLLRQFSGYSMPVV